MHPGIEKAEEAYRYGSPRALSFILGWNDALAHASKTITDQTVLDQLYDLVVKSHDLEKSGSIPVNDGVNNAQ